MTRAEAHALLYKGQTNVARLARELGTTLEDLQTTFRAYVAEQPPIPANWTDEH